jgi:hypothetical protein
LSEAATQRVAALACQAAKRPQEVVRRRSRRNLFSDRPLGVR